MHRRRRRFQQTHGVGAELSVLFGPAVRFGCALVQTQHELQVLVRFLLVRERPVVVLVVRVFVLLCALMTPTAAPQREVMRGRGSGTGRTEQVDQRGQDADTH